MARKFSIEESFCKSEKAYYEKRKKKTNLNMKQKIQKRYNNKHL